MDNAANRGGDRQLEILLEDGVEAMTSQARTCQAKNSADLSGCSLQAVPVRSRSMCKRTPNLASSPQTRARPDITIQQHPLGIVSHKGAFISAQAQRKVTVRALRAHGLAWPRLVRFQRS